MVQKGKNARPDDRIEEVVDKGLDVLESEEVDEDLLARREFLREVKRHALAVWRALGLFVLRKYPDEQKRHVEKNPRRKK